MWLWQMFGMSNHHPSVVNAEKCQPSKMSDLYLLINMTINKQIHNSFNYFGKQSSQRVVIFIFVNKNRYVKNTLAYAKYQLAQTMPKCKLCEAETFRASNFVILCRDQKSTVHIISNHWINGRLRKLKRRCACVCVCVCHRNSRKPTILRNMDVNQNHILKDVISSSYHSQRNKT